MKKLIMTSLTLSLFLSGAMAAETTNVNKILTNLEEQKDEARETYEENRQTLLLGKKDPKSFRSVKERQSQLEFAYALREKKAFKKEHLNPIGSKTSHAQKLQHLESRKRSAFQGRGTTLDRTGNLEYVPYYQYRRAFSDPSTLRSNRKQVSKLRAEDYLKKGNAGTQALTADIVRSKGYQVDRLNRAPKARAARAAARKTLTDGQRNIGRSKRDETRSKNLSRRVNNSGRLYTNPSQYSTFTE